MYIACGALNEDIKKAMKEHKVKQWQIAERLGVSEFTFSRWMRHELEPLRKTLVLDAIRVIVYGKQERG